MAGMRKLLALAGALALTLPIAACGGDKKPSAAEQTATVLADDTDKPKATPAEVGLSGISGTPAATAPAGTPGSPAAVRTNVPGATPPATGSTAAASTPRNTQSVATSAPGSTTVPSTVTPAAPASPVAPSLAALQLSSASGNRNQEVEVVLSTGTNAGSTLRGWIIDVEYDPAFAGAASCTVTGFAVCNENYRPQLVRFVGTADAAVSEIGRAKFKLVGPTGGSSTLRIIATECIDGAGGPVSCTASEATLRIN